MNPAPSCKSTSHRNVYQIVTEQIIRQLEKGVAPWQLPRGPPFCFERSAKTEEEREQFDANEALEALANAGQVGETGKRGNHRIAAPRNQMKW